MDINKYSLGKINTDSLLAIKMVIFIFNSLSTFFVSHFFILGDDSKRSYQELALVMNEVDFYKHGIKLTYQFSPLSWHFHSYKIHQGTFCFIKKLFSLYCKKWVLNKHKNS